MYLFLENEEVAGSRNGRLRGLSVVGLEAAAGMIALVRDEILRFAQNDKTDGLKPVPRMDEAGRSIERPYVAAAGELA